MSSIQEQFKTIVKNFTDECEKIGFYSDHVSIAADDPEATMEAESRGLNLRQIMEDENVNFGLFVEFSIRDFAFSDQVLDPEKAAIDREFEMMIPDDYESFKKTGMDDLTEGI